MTVVQLQAVPAPSNEPREPDWTDIFNDELDIASAKESWLLIISEMKAAKTLSVTNGPAIKRLVMAYSAYERSCREVATQGAVVKARKTRVPQYNLHWTIMSQADDMARKGETELGLSPRRRSGVTKAQTQVSGGRKSDAFLKRP
jgi:P27 family predicted phage terminase small subunit